MPCCGSSAWAPFSTANDLAGILPGAAVGKVAQQAVLRVDEEGTVAAALTEGAVVTSLEPDGGVAMVVDRPFALRIVHVETGWPLFQGVVNDPSD